MSDAPRPSLRERVAAHIRELIVADGLGPGEQLPTERELAQRLGVSRVPIREAIRTLSALGIVEVRGRQGMFVADGKLDATADELAAALLRQRAAFDELFAVRRLLEPASAQWAAARATDADVRRLRELLERMDAAAAADPPDHAAYLDADAALHLAIARASGNQVLRRILEAIQDLHRDQIDTSSRRHGRIDQARGDHRRIVEAIAARDPIGAHDAMLEHLARTERAARESLPGT
ncbi:MAG: FadR family transcriptional regulator [Solirubrobacteraceae bacterium]|nr:FadR family transcriptional regulator [Solirubrobacteraceae bacterium]